MTTPRTLTIRLADLTTAAVANATCTIFPIKADYTADLTVAMIKVTKTTDVNGEVTFDVVPNTVGSQNSKYRLVSILDEQNIIDVIFQMPDADSELNDLIDATLLGSTFDPATYAEVEEPLTITSNWTISGDWQFTHANWPGRVKTVYESNDDTNAFTDADKAKLAAHDAAITDLQIRAALEI